MSSSNLHVVSTSIKFFLYLTMNHTQSLFQHSIFAIILAFFPGRFCVVISILSLSQGLFASQCIVIKSNVRKNAVSTLCFCSQEKELCWCITSFIVVWVAANHKVRFQLISDILNISTVYIHQLLFKDYIAIFIILVDVRGLEINFRQCLHDFLLVCSVSPLPHKTVHFKPTFVCQLKPKQRLFIQLVLN